MNKDAARDISYASSAKGRSGRAMIRVMENATGRLRLIRKAKGYDLEVAAGQDFWKVMAERYGITLDVLSGSLDTIPREGPLVVVSNGAMATFGCWPTVFSAVPPIWKG